MQLADTPSPQSATLGLNPMVCLLAVPWVQLSVSAGNGWPHNALRHHWLMPIGCHFRDCKALLVASLTHVSGAITSVYTFTLTFTTPEAANLLVTNHHVLNDVHFSLNTTRYNNTSRSLPASGAAISELGCFQLWVCACLLVNAITVEPFEISS